MVNDQVYVKALLIFDHAIYVCYKSIQAGHIDSLIKKKSYEN